MDRRHTRRIRLSWILLLVACMGGATLVAQQRDQRGNSGDSQDGFKFRSAAELVNVTASVTDQSERFVSGLQKDDFIVYEDGVQQSVTHFSADRVPVSLGIVLDVSGSMDGEKWEAATAAIDRFLRELLDAEDEVFLYTFSERTDLVEEWTTDKARIGRALNRLRPRGGTAMYDAVSEAIPIAQSGSRRKKALVVVSDGNDRNSSIDVRSLRRQIRETEVLVYAIGIDGESTAPVWTGRPRQPRMPLPIPIPIPGGGRRFPPQWPGQPQPRYPGGYMGSDEGVDAAALREMTDDSGGRTEIVRDTRDLDPATASIADELSKQYSLGYPPAAAKDGRWHSIRVDVRQRGYLVRARKGYVAMP
jgi:Ca-activated chloride channel homolog